MEARSILTALIASLALLSVQPSYYMAVLADTNRENEGSKTQSNFRNFLNSVSRKDMEKSERYRTILEKEAETEQLAFDTVKEELHRSRQERRHTRYQNSFRNEGGRINEEPVFKRETETSSNNANEALIPLGSNRYCNVHEYKGRILVDMREHYTDKDGKLVPGKRGIALTPEQWTELKKAIGKIDQNLDHLLKTVPQQQGQSGAPNQELPF